MNYCIRAFLAPVLLLVTALSFAEAGSTEVYKWKGFSEQPATAESVNTSDTSIVKPDVAVDDPISEPEGAVKPSGEISEAYSVADPKINNRKQQDSAEEKKDKRKTLFIFRVMATLMFLNLL